ncbi:MAG: alpha-L-fucosidase, partial [Bacteroidales bacterium]|nr:alpha-L-fucosidase [Bacteroidales bacterium]
MILLLSFRGVLALPSDVSKGDARMDWWRDARFGMFIHWGLYSQCEGYWKGKSIDGIGEWIMKMAEIPVDEYERLAGTFTAERYDPEKWVQLAKQAGMKYIVITAKHHDGFALFKSE